MPGGGGGDSDSTQTQVPWAAQQGPLKKVYSEAQNLYGSGQLGALGPQSPYTQAAQGMTAARALGGGYGLADRSAQALGGTISGDYLSQGNPYLQSAIAYGQQPVIDAWNSQIAPGIDASFSAGGGAGALGSGAYAAARNRAEDTLARNLSGAATQAAYQNYGDERTRQMQGLAIAPQVEQLGYYGADRLAQVGAQADARAQMEAETPSRALQQYTSLITQTPFFGTTTTNQSSSGGGTDWLSTGLGSAALLGSLFLSDERAKTDIKKVGKLDSGEGVYTYRYKMNPFKMHVGVMAQEVEKKHPEAVHDVGGVKMVDYAAL